jgi:hypothetical protein
MKAVIILSEKELMVIVCKLREEDKRIIFKEIFINRYFIHEGVVDIIKPNNEVLTTLSDGSYFGGMN